MGKKERTRGTGEQKLYVINLKITLNFAVIPFR